MAETTDDLFGVFNEIGIVNQLATALFNSRMPSGLHISHFAILNHLCRLGDGRSPSRIAGALQVTRATMTHSIDVLTKAGLVTTEPDPDDGRGRLVFLTADGRSARDAAIAEMGRTMGSLVDGELADRLIAIKPVLADLRKLLDAARS